jgi:hypothetical protein
METSTLNWYYRRTIDALRYEGLLILTWRFLKWCLSPLGYLDLMTFFRRDLTQPLGKIQAKVEFTVGQAVESDIEQLAAMVARRYGPGLDRLWPYRQGVQDTILERFRSGCKCFVARNGAELLHYNWIFPRWEKAVMGNYRSSLRDDEALCNDGFTEEAWRGKGVHAVVNNQMCRYLQQAGYRCVYTSASTDNKSSQKALHRLGWEFYGIMLYFIPRGSQKTWWRRIKGNLDPSDSR